MDRRLQEHQEGIDEKCYTYKRRPLVLKYYELTSRIEDAIAREKQIKGWSRKKKEALMAGDIDELERLAIRRSKISEQNPTIK